MTEKITTAEELDALPVGSVVVNPFDNSEFHKARSGKWVEVGGGRWLSTEMVQDEQEYRLYRPDAPAPVVEDRDGLVKAGTDLAAEHLGYADMSVRVLVERIIDAALAARQPAPVDEGLVEQMADDIFDVHPSPSLGAEIARHLLGKGWTRQPAPTASAQEVTTAQIEVAHEKAKIVAGKAGRARDVEFLRVLGVKVRRG